MITLTANSDYEHQRDAIAIAKQHDPSLRIQKKTSNLFRTRNITQSNHANHTFNRVLSIDLDKLTVTAEGMISYDDLVATTLRYGCLPAVVPELKTITLGGAIAGVGVESSSFRYGLVHETILELDILLPSGTVVTATPDNQHQDLFFMFPNSYGSLGHALRVVARLVKCQPYVKLSHHRYKADQDYYQALSNHCHAHQNSDPTTFVEGVIFNDQEKIITTAQGVSDSPQLSCYTYRHIYYHSLRKRHTDYLSTHDYIWRWDSDWFWCSKTFGMEWLPWRLLLGKWMLNSASYWKISHWVKSRPLVMNIYARCFPRLEPVIQDVAIPLENASTFYEFFRDKIGIQPLWQCPIKAGQHHYPLFPLTPNQLYINFGFWSSVISNQPEGYYNRMIEQQVSQLGGRKSLYSSVHYTEQEFWQQHNLKAYQKIKLRYDPNNLGLSLYTKCR